MCNLVKLFKKRLLFERFIKRAKNTSFKMTNILTPIPYRRESATGKYKLIKKPSFAATPPKESLDNIASLF